MGESQPLYFAFTDTFAFVFFAVFVEFMFPELALVFWLKKPDFVLLKTLAFFLRFSLHRIFFNSRK